MKIEHKEGHVPAWRSRRGQYLRASGRTTDLIREDFESAPEIPTLSVIAGGRKRTLVSHNSESRLFVVPKTDEGLNRRRSSKSMKTIILTNMIVNPPSSRATRRIRDHSTVTASPNMF